MQQFELYEKSLEFALNEYQIEPESTDNINLVGQLYLNIDSTDKAIYYFSRSITLAPKDYLTHYLRANAYMIKDEKELAYKDFSSCLSLNPNFEDALIEKIKVGNQLRKTDVCKDIDKLRQINLEIESDIIRIKETECR